MIQGKYSLHNTPAQEIACPCECSEVLHKQVGTQIVSLKLVCCFSDGYFSFLVLFICHFWFLGAVFLVKCLRIIHISVTKKLKLSTDRTRKLRKSVQLEISKTSVDRGNGKQTCMLR